MLAFGRAQPTELLSAADIEGVLPHQLTRKIVEHFDTVFTPRGIRYETHRTSQARQMKFSHDGNDADDANDAEIDITQRFQMGYLTNSVISVISVTKIA